MNKIKALTLIDLNLKIQGILKASITDYLWVVAEINELRTNTSGHCYLELAQKDENTDTIIAKARANIWSYTWRMLQPYFESTTGQKLSDGMQVLAKVKVEFHELYGYSLNIVDIDPNYTLGDIEKRKKEIIQKLEDDGILDLNKTLELPEVIQKIAIISSPTAAGYGDFIDQIENNPYGYKFYHKLFAASMQGKDAEQSITKALDSIYQYEEIFDAVIIIRGGGSKLDLSCFDNYWIAANIAQFPLPVLTGIGHERDDTIADMVAHTKLKTPTAVAEFIISLASDYDYRLDEAATSLGVLIKNQHINQKQTLIQLAHKLKIYTQKLIHKHNSALQHNSAKVLSESRALFSSQENKLTNNIKQLKSSSLSKLLKNDLQTEMLGQNIKKSMANRIQNEKRHLHFLEEKNNLIDPMQLLKKGYSISLSKNKIIKSINSIKEGDELETLFADGQTMSTITKIKK